jgi:hypothetical protein
MTEEQYTVDPLFDPYCSSVQNIRLTSAIMSLIQLVNKSICIFVIWIERLTIPQNGTQISCKPGNMYMDNWEYTVPSINHSEFVSSKQSGIACKSCICELLFPPF